jgi:hypothetical protein
MKRVDAACRVTAAEAANDGLVAELARWQDYLEALDAAGQAMDRARRIFPDHGLDHGVERVRFMLTQGVAEMERLQQDATAGAG